MLSTFVENKGILKGVYKNIEPSLRSLYIREFLIVTGEDLRVILKFDTYELPMEIPHKWQEIGVNTVQFMVEFIDVDLSFVNISNVNFQKVEMSLHSLDNKIQVVCSDVFGNEVFCFDSKWIYLKNITGYQNSKATQ